MSGPRVCAHSGVSYRQLDYWCRAKVLLEHTPPTYGSGSRRMFSPEAAQILRVLSRLCMVFGAPTSAAWSTPTDILQRCASALIEAGLPTKGFLVISDGKPTATAGRFGSDPSAFAIGEQAVVVVPLLPSDRP